LGGFKSSKPRHGDIFGDINSQKHSATLVPGVMLDTLQQLASGGLPSWSSSTLVWPFGGRLAGMSHHLKSLALSIYGSWGYAGHF